MLRRWLAWASERFQRDVLGRGRPRVGSRRRDRLPPALRRTELEGLIHRLPPRPVAGQPRILAARPSRPGSVRPGYAAAFLLAVAALLGILWFGLDWALAPERAPLGQAPGVGAAMPPPTPRERARTPTPRPSPVPTVAPAPTPNLYVVQPGDTLSRIAREHGTTVEALVETNQLDPRQVLSVGARLVIPPPTLPPDR